jgi:signal peptidase I
MRIVALPSESVSFATGDITINGQPLVLPSHVTNVLYVSLDHPALIGHGSRIPSPFVVPNGCYFVLGDCSTNSHDSRMWGALPRNNIVGRVRDK